jgi:PAS domain S-box-containing protein
VASRLFTGGVIRTQEGGSKVGLEGGGSKLGLQVGGPLLTLAAVILFDILTRRGIGLPVPMLLLLLPVVASGIFGGLRPAIISVVLVLLYSLHFYSVPGSPLTYDATGLRQLVAVFLALPAVALAVGALRQRQLDRADEPAPSLTGSVTERVEFPGGSIGTVAMAVARNAANTLAEWSTVNLLDAAGRLRCVAAAHRFAPRDPAARELMTRVPREADGRVTPAGVWGGPEAVVLDVDEPVLAALSASPEERLIYGGLAPSRILTVPLRARGRALGVLELGSADPDGLSSASIPAAERFAERVSHALDAAASAAIAEDAERRYRMLFESHPNAMWIFDTESLGFLDVNESAVRQYGYSRAEFLAMTIMEVLPENDAAAAVPSPERRPNKRDEVALSRHQKKDGTVIDVEIVSHALIFAGRPARLVLVTDVSDRARTRVALREREEQLRRAQKSDAAARLASGVAHDFNNVLTAIRGYSDLLLGELEPSDPRAHDLEEIRRAADRGAMLTRQLLAFGQRQPVQAEAVDLNEVVRSLESLLQRLVGADVQLEMVLAPAIGRIRADAGQIEQVVMNLVLNARDAMQQGGTLTIETSERQISAPGRGRGGRPGWYVVLAVTDSGIGMDEETRARVFEPFFSTKQAAQGSGLGLAIVHGIVKNSGGMIRLSSEPGAGTSVRLFFPRLDDAAAAVLGAEPSDARGMETILLVEDEEPVRAVVRKTLSANGYTVLEARHGRDALLASDRHRGPIHLLLSDVVMPEMGGRELAERLTAQRQDLRVLFMSGYTSDEVVRKGIEGAGFMQKPFTSADLLRAVRERLDEPAEAAEAVSAEPA